jgi:Mce-associated membrane protein
MKTRTKDEKAPEAEDEAVETEEKTEASEDADRSAEEDDAKDAGQDEDPGDSVEEPEETGRGGIVARGLRTPWLGKAVTMVVLIASVVTAGLQWHRAEAAADREADRKDVAERAEQFGQALLSYDHKNLQAARNRVLGMSSDDFAKTYDVAFTGGLEGVITKLKADATATPRSVYVSDLDEGNAKAVVVMDSEVHSTAGTRRVLGSYLDMKLTRHHGQWKVTEVNSIGAANESMTDPNGKQTGPSPSASSTPSP